jgi:hypothetical protein
VKSGLIARLCGEAGDVDMPVKYCRLLFLPCDEVLNILYSCSFDITAAIKSVSQRIESSSFEISMLPDEMNMFVVVAKK